MSSIIAYHGWGFDCTCWQDWAARFEQAGIGFRAIDRGYFRAEIGGESPSRVIFVHSYGLHLCPIAHLQQADLLVIFSSFQMFHPQKESAKRRSQQILQQMLTQLRNYPIQVLDNFRQKCDMPSAQIKPDSLNLDRLVADLQDLGSCAIDLAMLANLPQIVVFHGAGDRIVPVQKGRELAKALSNSLYFEIAEAGHALPFTHLEECGAILQQVMVQ